jgi:hypothetical protein
MGPQRQLEGAGEAELQETVLRACATCVQVLGTQPPPASHGPQLRRPPQPSGTEPHAPLEHVCGVQLDEVTHCDGLPWHCCPAAHVPHRIVPPQSLSCRPHVAPMLLQVRGVQLPPHWLATPPPPQR